MFLLVKYVRVTYKTHQQHQEMNAFCGNVHTDTRHVDSADGKREGNSKGPSHHPGVILQCRLAGWHSQSRADSSPLVISLPGTLFTHGERAMPQGTKN